MKTDTLEKQDVQNTDGLAIFVRNVFGTGEVRIVLPDGTVVSKAVARVLTLTDGSEIFEVVVR